MVCKASDRESQMACPGSMGQEVMSDGQRGLTFSQLSAEVKERRKKWPHVAKEEFVDLMFVVLSAVFS